MAPTAEVAAGGAPCSAPTAVQAPDTQLTPPPCPARTALWARGVAERDTAGGRVPGGNNTTGSIGGVRIYSQEGACCEYQGVLGRLY